jgi:hypothetical protein
MMETVPQTLPFSKGRGVRARGLVEDRLHKTLLVYRYLLATFPAWLEQRISARLSAGFLRTYRAPPPGTAATGVHASPFPWVPCISELDEFAGYSRHTYGIFIA